MNIITRAQSGLRPPKKRSTGNLNRPSTGHWNGPKVPVVDHSRCAALVRGIQNFHMDGRGWNDIAYNYVICAHGYVFEGRGLNVINGANGINSANKNSHAVMWLAGQGNSFTKAEKDAFLSVVRYISEKTSAPNDAVGHRDHKSTECPGNERHAWIHSSVPGTVAKPKPPSKPVAKPSEKRPTLRRGSRNAHVRTVQTIIKNRAGGEIGVDGIFGRQTERRVKDLQWIFKLKQDGIVGPKTWSVLDFLNSK